MALKVQEVMGAVLVLMVMVWGGAQAQPTTCINSLVGLSPCLTYVTGNSSTPTPACCSQLANVVQSQPQCLCSLLNGNLPSIGVTINQTLAVALPGACKVQTPPVSLCNGVANGPAGAPAAAPTSSGVSPTGSATDTEPSEGTPEGNSPTTPSTTSTPSGSGSGSGSGSKATPSTNNNASHGSKFGAPIYLLLVAFIFGVKF